MIHYLLIKKIHLLTVTVSVVLLLLRFYWLQRGSLKLQQRWVKILPHINDTLLLISGVVMVVLAHYYPFTPQGEWLTEKLFGVIIYISLGFVALSRRPRSQGVRWSAFILALITLSIIGKLAITKLPLLGIV
ncbi:MAG: Protein YchQ [Candidatus Erwinia impunctatus]|nr:Protein YchQ [Culicoides impunctatus]